VAANTWAASASLAVEGNFPLYTSIPVQGNARLSQVIEVMDRARGLLLPLTQAR
jgi:hypothetical protein